MADERPSHPGESRRLTTTMLQALAHPIRFRLLEMLQLGGAATASMLARELGESSGTTSYHLRQLAAADLIREADELGDARDRWWEAVGGWTIDDDHDSEDDRGDVDIIFDQSVGARVARLRTWQAHRREWGKRWRDSTTLSFRWMALTPDEMWSLANELAEVAERYKGLRDRDNPPPGTAKVIVQTDVYPFGHPQDDPG
ncbi:winged helix-turn-helix domain-containing protein [Euzebya tangerina]|uniref:winged helix-turn-helix domain-containing protein n=1 Tax=Euzebya tangerina TaxID=591198 RepID=UPI000E31B59C|nr:helix-turn-helix domain-containing protein [Euzebya tangerina]